MFNSSKTSFISSFPKSTFSDVVSSVSTNWNLAHVPEVPIPPHKALQLRRFGCETPDMLTDVSPTFPAKNPSIPKSSSLGLSIFIRIVIGVEMLSFRKSEYGDFPVIALANALNALSLFVFKPPSEFAKIAALLSANET